MASWVRLGALSAVLACGALASAAAFAQSPPVNGNAARGKVLSYTCLGCHGIAGYRNAYPDYEVPELWGQHPEYIVAALQAYKSGQRAHVTMRAQASTLSDQDIADIAAYFGSHPLQRGATPVSARTPPAAAAVCVACHGADGIGVVPQYPSLAGQHADYIVQALREYKNGERKNPIMAGMASQVTEQNMEVLADYYAGLRPALGTLPRPYSILTLGH